VVPDVLKGQGAVNFRTSGSAYALMQ